MIFKFGLSRKCVTAVAVANKMGYSLQNIFCEYVFGFILKWFDRLGLTMYFDVIESHNGVKKILSRFMIV